MRTLLILVSMWTCNQLVYSSEVVGCTTNTTYLKLHPNNSSTCVPCSTCPPGYGVVTRCTNNTNTMCEPCPDGTYNDAQDGACKTCSHCEPGTYIYRKCVSYSDVMCAKCPDGYMSLSNDSGNCQPCKICQREELTSRECSGTNDTICGDCVRDHFRDESTRECVPCSQCHGNLSVIVPECQEKLGHSQEVCQPLGYVPRTRTDSMTTLSFDITSTLATHTQVVADIEMNNAMLLVAVLFTIVLITVFSVTIVFVMRHRRPQKVVRLCRDSMKKTGYHLTHNCNNDCGECCNNCFVLSKNGYSSKAESPYKLCRDNDIECTDFNHPNPSKRDYNIEPELLKGDNCETVLGIWDIRDDDKKYPVKCPRQGLRTEYQSTSFQDEISVIVDGKYDNLSAVDSGIGMAETSSKISDVSNLSDLLDGGALEQGPVAPQVMSDESHTRQGGPTQHVVTIEKYRTATY